MNTVQRRLRAKTKEISHMLSFKALCTLQRTFQLHKQGRVIPASERPAQTSATAGTQARASTTMARCF
jgi:hypothetical protein